MDPRYQAQLLSVHRRPRSDLREARVPLYRVIPLDLDKRTEATAFLCQNFRRAWKTRKRLTREIFRCGRLAEQSGGLAIGPTGDIYGSVVRCVADANAYYELSFDSAAASRVDVYRGLQVRLDKSWLAARTNTGYYAQP